MKKKPHILIVFNYKILFSSTNRFLNPEIYYVWCAKCKWKLPNKPQLFLIQKKKHSPDLTPVDCSLKEIARSRNERGVGGIP
jgi:hypothetical protein